jgi:hypothetical protein
LIGCWKELVENEYAQRRVNSERSLQAAYWAKLNEALSPRTHRIFIEPRLSPDGGTTSLFPDLVICNSQRVIAVIELKYQPRVKPSIIKDLNSLTALANTDDIALTADRYAGPRSKSRSYELNNNVLYVWAGIHRPTPEDLIGVSPITCPELLEGRFLCLRAVTSRDAAPVIRVEQ